MKVIEIQIAQCQHFRDKSSGRMLDLSSIFTVVKLKNSIFGPIRGTKMRILKCTVLINFNMLRFVETIFPKW